MTSAQATPLARIATCCSVVLLIACGLFACGQKDEAPTALKEMQKVTSGDVEVVLLARADALTQGKDSFVLEFRGADGRLRDVGMVRANATMPMAGMAPMFGDVDIKPGDGPGRYEVTSTFGMAGTWQINVEWDGPAGKGSALVRGTVR